MNLRYANSFGNITKCVPAIAFNYFPVFETFAFPATCTGREDFIGLLQTEISFSLYEVPHEYPNLVRNCFSEWSNFVPN